MSTALSRRLLPLAGVVIGLVARRAESAIEVTGLWNLAIGTQQGSLELVQTGGTLQAGGSWAVNYGSIDSTTGAFTLNLAQVGPPSCGTFTGTVSADSRTLSGMAHLFTTPPDCPSIGCFCSVDTVVPLWGSRAPCGDGVLDPGEACDDGHLPPGDCCALGCTLDPAGSACADDGNVCTDESCDGSGTCLHTANTASCDSTCAPGGVCASGVCESPQPAPTGTTCDRDGNACTVDTCNGTGTCAAAGPLDCGPCAVCEPPGGCQAYVRPYCPSSISGDGRRRLDLRKGSDASRDRAIFSWSDPGPSDPVVFGDPTQSTDYAMCMFQPPSSPEGDATPVGALSIPAAGTCEGRACWSPVRDGFRLRNRAARRDGGATTVTLRASATSGTTIAVRGAGAPLRLSPSLDVPAVLVQVIERSGGADLACWEASFTTPTRRTANRFTARR
jgi:cysteine-rich repeat protein